MVDTEHTEIEIGNTGNNIHSENEKNKKCDHQIRFVRGKKTKLFI